MDYAATVITRLPPTFAALHAGVIHPVHVKIIEEETSILSAQDATAWVQMPCSPMKITQRLRLKEAPGMNGRAPRSRSKAGRRAA